MLIQVAGDCDDGRICPAVYVADDDQDTVVIQGYQVALEQLVPPAGESAVRIPRALLLDAARRLDGR